MSEPLPFPPRCRKCGYPTRPGVEAALAYCVDCAQRDQLRATRPVQVRRPEYRTPREETQV